MKTNLRQYIICHMNKTKTSYDNVFNELATTAKTNFKCTYNNQKFINTDFLTEFLTIFDKENSS